LQASPQVRGIDLESEKITQDQADYAGERYPQPAIPGTPHRGDVLVQTSHGASKRKLQVPTVRAA
jgi:hypothetical protein